MTSSGSATKAPEMNVQCLSIRKTRVGGKRKYAIRLGRILKLKRWE